MQVKKVRSLLLIIASVALAACTPPQNNQKDNRLAENIIGGREATLEFQKENGVVLLVIFQERLSATGTVATSQSLCTGTLISPTVVLSAAHCFISPGVKAVAVALNNNIEQTKQEDVIFVEEVKINEAYNPERVDGRNFVDGHPHGDIALLKLKRAVPSDFKPAPMPDASAPALKAGDNLTIAGYGVNVAVQNQIVKDPKTGAEKVIPVTSGNSGSGVLRVVHDVAVSKVTSDGKEFAVDESLQRNACHGDSGGPVYKMKSDGKLMLVGVVSRGTNPIGNCDQTGVFTDVSGYLNWVTSTAQALQ